MSVLTELRRLLDAYGAAMRVYKEPLPISEHLYQERKRAMFEAADRLDDALTVEAIRALLEAVEAAEREPRCPFCAEERHIAGWPTQPHLSDCPLAPLVKEATDE
mgnify:CR=1 FL=1